VITTRQRAIAILYRVESVLSPGARALIAEDRPGWVAMIAELLDRPPAVVKGFAREQWQTGGKWVKGDFPVRGASGFYLVDGMRRDGLGVYAWLNKKVVLVHSAGFVVCEIPIGQTESRTDWNRTLNAARIEARELANHLLTEYPGFVRATTESEAMAQLEPGWLDHVRQYLARYRLNFPVLKQTWTKRGDNAVIR
jgi:hypothetical protein